MCGLCTTLYSPPPPAQNDEVLVHAPKPLMDHNSSVVSQISVAQQVDDTDGTIMPQSTGLATCTTREADTQEKENDDWQLFKEAFEQEEFKVPETSAPTDFLSSAVVKQLRQDLIAELMLSFHDAQCGSDSVPADDEPAQTTELTTQSDSTLSFDKLDLVEHSIDHLLKECESDEVFRDKLSAAAGSSPPLYDAYSSDKAGDDLMQELVAHHVQNMEKFEVSNSTVVQAASRLEPENAPAVVFTPSTAGKLLLISESLIALSV